jgi:ABC-type multidrug transport system fused ATPase/permease subunit
VGILAWLCVIAWAAIVASIGYRIVGRRGRSSTSVDWACIAAGAVIGSAISPLWYPASGVLAFDGMDVPRALGAALPGGLLMELLYRVVLHPGRPRIAASADTGAVVGGQMAVAAPPVPAAPVAAPAAVAAVRQAPPPADTVISVEHLHKAYGQTVAVDDVSFSIGEGEIFGIIGPNGAGKTTTVESISGLRRPDSGQIAVLGLDPVRDRDGVRHLVGVQLQESRLPGRVRVGELLSLFSSFYPHPADAGELLEELSVSTSRS